MWHNLAFGNCLQSIWALGRSRIDHDLYPAPNAADCYRAMCATRFYEAKEYTHWLSLDADIGFEASVIEALLAFDRPIVLAPGPYRNSPRLACSGPRDAPQRENGRFQQIEFAGLCCALIKREVMDSLENRYPNFANFDRKYKMCRWFDRMDHPENGLLLEPDHAFLQRCKSEGYEIWAYLEGKLTHV